MSEKEETKLSEDGWTLHERKKMRPKTNETVKMLERYAAPKDKILPPLSDDAVIMSFVEHFDLQYLTVVFDAFLKSNGYEDADQLRKEMPLALTIRDTFTAVFPFKINYQAWEGTFQVLQSSDHDDNFKRFNMMIIRLPNDGAIYRAATAYHAIPLGDQLWHHFTGWHLLPKQTGPEKFQTIITYAAKYLEVREDELQYRILYHDGLDRVDFQLTSKDDDTKRFGVTWERGTPVAFLKGHPKVAQFVDVWE